MVMVGALLDPALSSSRTLDHALSSSRTLVQAPGYMHEKTTHKAPIPTSVHWNEMVLVKLKLVVIYLI